MTAVTNATRFTTPVLTVPSARTTESVSPSVSSVHRRPTVQTGRTVRGAPMARSAIAVAAEVTTVTPVRSALLVTLVGRLAACV